jgi:hypothetical protein
VDESLHRKAVTIGILLVTLVVVMSLLGSFYRRTARTRTLVLPFDVAACDDDGDCGLVNQIGCCPCQAGGGQGAVNPRMRGLLKDFIRHVCQQRTACIEVEVCRLDLQPRCRNHQCVLLSPTELAATGAG